MIRPFTRTDLDRISGLQPDGWYDVTPVFRFYVDVPFCLPFKIEDESGITALGCAILHLETAWLAHIIVAPDARRKGLGRTMTRALIHCAEQQGRATQLLIATEMGAPLYASLGFRRTCDYGFFRLREPVAETLPGHRPEDGPEHRPEAVSTHLPDSVRPLEAADIAPILALDLGATGENRESLLRHQGGRGWVYVAPNSGKVHGFYLPELGDGLIVADDDEAGVELMRVRMMHTSGRPALPVGNGTAVGFLAASGYELERTAPRMVRGGEDSLNHGMVFNRVGGNLG